MVGTNEAAPQSAERYRLLKNFRSALSAAVLALAPLPAQAGDTGVFGLAELLYLRPSDTTGGYAASYDTPAGVLGSASIVSLDRRFRPAYRTGLGYRFSQDADLRVVFMDFQSRDSSAVSKPANGRLGALWRRSIGEFRADSASAAVDILVRTVDAEGGRRFGSSDRIHSRVSVGLRYLYVRQLLRATYVGDTFGAGTPFETSSRFGGLGITAGIENGFYLTKALALRMRLSGAMVSGNFNNDVSQAFAPYSVSEARHMLIPGWEMGAAFAYVSAISQDLGAEVSLGYAFQRWSNLGASPNNELTNPSQPTGNLDLEGITLQLALRF